MLYNSPVVAQGGICLTKPVKRAMLRLHFRSISEWRPVGQIAIALNHSAGGISGGLAALSPSLSLRPMAKTRNLACQLARDG